MRATSASCRNQVPAGNSPAPRQHSFSSVNSSREKSQRHHPVAGTYATVLRRQRRAMAPFASSQFPIGAGSLDRRNVAFSGLQNTMFAMRPSYHVQSLTRQRGSTVEQLICNQWVAGSIPVAGSIKNRVSSVSADFFALWVFRYKSGTNSFSSPHFRRFPFCKSSMKPADFRCSPLLDGGRKRS